MPTMVALLRGVNVGGRTTLPMATLRDAAEACGGEAVRTYIQSGNVVFRTSARRTAAVADDLAQAVATAAEVRPQVLVRTLPELRAVLDASPFLARGVDPAHLHVLFTDEAKARVPLDDLERYLPEEVIAVGRELHLHLPSGVGRSKLAADLARQQGATGTMRNWRTVTKLVDLAEEIDAGG